MRELKFRAWDNLEKRMCEIVSLHWRDGKLVSARLEGDNEPIPIEGRLEIEQTTELTDKNDGEIYEGDIVQGKFFNNKVVGEVRYSLRFGRYYVRTLQKTSYHFGDFYPIGSPRLKNLGNIHENFELLEEK